MMQQIDWGPVECSKWMSWVECIKFIGDNGQREITGHPWIKNMLDNLSVTATPEQRCDILNGYANLYELKMILIRSAKNNDEQVHSDGVIIYPQTSNIRELQLRDVTYIVYDSEQWIFLPLFIVKEDKQLQTCFPQDNLPLHQHISNCIFGNTKNNHSLVQCANLNNTPAVVEESMKVLNFNAEENDSESGLQLVANVTDNLDGLEKLLDQARNLKNQVEDCPSMESGEPARSLNENNHEQTLSLNDSVIKQDRTRIRRKRQSGHLSAPLSATINTVRVEATISNSSGIELSEPYDAPEILKQPRRYRRVRMSNDLEKKECPLVQAGEGKQRVYPEIRVPSVPTGTELFIRIRAVTSSGARHPLKCALPEDATVDFSLMVDNNERKCLLFDPSNFDRENEYVYLMINDQELKKRRKEIKVRLFNWKHSPWHRQDYDQEDLRLCKLELCFCIPMQPNEYEPVSPLSYTSVIEDGDGELFIDSSQIEPKQLCSLGGQKITVPLSVKCQKKDFTVEFDDTKITEQSFTMERNRLSITAPPQKPDKDQLHLTILKKEPALDTADRGKTVYEDDIPYLAHEAHDHRCPQSKSNHLYSDIVLSDTITANPGTTNMGRSQ